VGGEQIDEALRAIVGARAALNALERTIVVHGRSQGRTWADLGASLGISGQGVRRRHLAGDPIAAGRPRRRLTDEEYRDRVHAWAVANGYAR
jgi:hypothetical protein